MRKTRAEKTEFVRDELYFIADFLVRKYGDTPIQAKEFIKEQLTVI